MNGPFTASWWYVLHLLTAYEVLVLPDVFEDGIPSQLSVSQIKTSHILTLHVLTDPLLPHLSTVLGCTHLQYFVIEIYTECFKFFIL